MNSDSQPLGLIAGSGSFPFEFTKSAHEKGLKVFAIGFDGETDPALKDLVDEYKSIKLGQLGKLIKILKKSNVKKVAFAGAIAKKRFLSDIRPDLKAIMMIAKMKSAGDDTILRGIAGEIEKIGIEIFSASEMIENCLPVEGLLTKRDFSQKELEDVRLGWDICKKLGDLDVGQTIIVKQKIVIAVEALEGTDKAILRAGEISFPNGYDQVQDGLVVVKLAKPNQDLRLDLPTVGIQTLESMKEAGGTALVLEEKKCNIIDPIKFVELANKLKIAIRIFQSKDK